MTKMITIHNVETGEVIEREMTLDEIAEDNDKQAKAEAERVAQEAGEATKAAARQAVLDKLGLTADDVTALLG